MLRWLKNFFLPEKKQTLSAKQVVSIGDIAQIEIPSDLPYAGALKRIQSEAVGTGVTINTSRFYSESAIELHNFTSSITYRFIESQGIKAIAYIIEDRDFYSCDYKEIDYTGKMLFTFSGTTLSKKEKTAEDIEFIKRANRTLGIYRHIMPEFQK